VAMPLLLGVGREGPDMEQGGVQLIEGLLPPLVAASGELDRVSRKCVAARSPLRRELIRIGQGRER
jgi:hypothetical protein